MDPTAQKVLTRQELLDLVWSIAGKDLAPELGVSDSGLAKICRRHRVPRPPRGFFLMREDRRPAKPELDDVEDPRLAKIAFGPASAQAPKEPTIDPTIAALIETERSPENKIVVPQKLTHPSRL